MSDVIHNKKTFDYHLIVVVDDSPTFLVINKKRISTIHGKTSLLCTLFLTKLEDSRCRKRDNINKEGAILPELSVRLTFVTLDGTNKKDSRLCHEKATKLQRVKLHTSNNHKNNLSDPLCFVFFQTMISVQNESQAYWRSTLLSMFSAAYFLVCWRTGVLNTIWRTKIRQKRTGWQLCLYCQQCQKIVKIHPKMVVEMALFIAEFAE